MNLVAEKQSTPDERRRCASIVSVTLYSERGVGTRAGPLTPPHTNHQRKKRASESHIGLTTRLTPVRTATKVDLVGSSSIGSSEATRLCNRQTFAFTLTLHYFISSEREHQHHQNQKQLSNTIMSQQTPRMSLNDSISNMGQEWQISNQGSGAVGESAADIEIYMGEQSNSMGQGNVMGGGSTPPPLPSTKPQESK